MPYDHREVEETVQAPREPEAAAPSSHDEGTDASRNAASGVISGQFPRVPWHPNPGGQTRSVEEAIGIARRNGVQIPEDVAFFVDELGELGPTITARAPEVRKLAGDEVRWSDLVNHSTGKVPIIIRPDVLQSDEAIVAVFAHELHEIEGFRRIIRRRGSISIEEFIANHAWDNPGNLHDAGWEIADALVRRMRGETL
jgi:hypothetical protein